MVLKNNIHYTYSEVPKITNLIDVILKDERGVSVLGESGDFKFHSEQYFWSILGTDTRNEKVKTALKIVNTCIQIMLKMYKVFKTNIRCSERAAKGYSIVSRPLKFKK